MLGIWNGIHLVLVALFFLPFIPHAHHRAAFVFTCHNFRAPTAIPYFTKPPVIAAVVILLRHDLSESDSRAPQRAVNASARVFSSDHIHYACSTFCGMNAEKKNGYVPHCVVLAGGLPLGSSDWRLLLHLYILPLSCPLHNTFCYELLFLLDGGETKRYRLPAFHSCSMPWFFAGLFIPHYAHHTLPAHAFAARLLLRHASPVQARHTARTPGLAGPLQAYGALPACCHAPLPCRRGPSFLRLWLPVARQADTLLKHSGSGTTRLPVPRCGTADSTSASLQHATHLYLAFLLATRIPGFVRFITCVRFGLNAKTFTPRPPTHHTHPRLSGISSLLYLVV